MPNLPAALTGFGGGDVTQGKPPGSEIGVAHQVAAPGGWAAFLDEAEYVPELTFPQSAIVYHRMRSDTQIEALHLGTTQPIREYRWMIEPNGADKKLVENAATDLGLPVRGVTDEEGHVKRAATVFDFDRWLQDALLAPMYGFMDFEIVGTNSPDDGWRMDKLAPRHPRTIQQLKEGPHGDLEAIRQTYGPGPGEMPQPIPASSLLHFVWRPEAGSHVGRSMLRSMYREWLVKERTTKIAVVNIERGTGVPVIVGPQGASNKQLEELGTMARQFKVADGGGGAIPFGSKLELAAGSVPDAIALLTYCDEAMARVWALMLIQLGQTATGSRALGGEFAIYAARAQRLMGKWICATVNGFLDRYVEWNDPLADYAPRLIFEPPQPEGLSVTDLVSLLDAGALTVDPELEDWLRQEFALPQKPEMPEHEDLGELTPDEVALVQNSRNPPALPGADPTNPDIPVVPGGKTYQPTPMPKKALDPTSTAPTIAEHEIALPRLHRGIRASLTLPARPLRRPPSANEIRAAVDFATLDRTHANLVSSLHHDYLNGTLPTQIGELADQLRSGVAAHALQAPVVRQAQLTEHLQAAAKSGVESGIREAQVQGITFSPSQVADAHDQAARAAERQAEHVANLNANGLSLGAQRRAGRLSNLVRGREAKAKDLEAHLTGQKHVFERENLKGSVTMAQNAGRIAAFGAVAPEQATATYEASEILDDRTCGPCEAVDGTIYESLDEAEADYAAGGYIDCEGGPNCRGTLVAVYGEQNPETGEGPLGEAEPPIIEPGGDTGGTDVEAPEAEVPDVEAGEFEKVAGEGFDAQQAIDNLTNGLGPSQPVLDTNAVFRNDAVDPAAFERRKLDTPERVVVSSPKLTPTMERVNRINVEHAIANPDDAKGVLRAARLPDGSLAVLREDTGHALAQMLGGKYEHAVEVVEAWGDKAITDQQRAEMLTAIENAPDFKAAAAAFNAEVAQPEHVIALGHHALPEAERRLEVFGEAEKAERGRLEVELWAARQDFEKARDVFRAERAAADERGEDIDKFLVGDKTRARIEADPESVLASVRAYVREEERYMRADSALRAHKSPTLADVLPGLIGEVRGMGGELDLATPKMATHAAAEAANVGRMPLAESRDADAEMIRQGVATAESRLPSSWIEASNAAGKIEPVVAEGENQRAFHLGLVRDFEVKGNGGHIVTIGDGRIFASKREWQGFDRGSTILHEFTHRMQMVVPHLQRLEGEFFAKRAATDSRGVRPLKELTKIDSYGPDERAIEDRFTDAYTGKVYTRPEYEQAADGSVRYDSTTMTQRPAEIATMGNEGLYFGAYDTLTDDRELAEFMAGVMMGL